MNTPWRRLNRNEISLLRFLAAMANSQFAARLTRRQRADALPLWRRGIVCAWYRQVPDCTPALQGPYWTLSARGMRLAVQFTRPRGSAAQYGGARHG